MTGERQVERTIEDEWAWQPAERPLPRAVDVAIVGGGVVGCSTAYFLAREGVSVAVFEKGRIAGEQSGRNWGWVRQQGRSPVELPLMMRSLALWQRLADELGEDVGFRQGGCLYLAETGQQLQELEPFLVTAREHGLDTRVLARHEVGDVLRGAGERWAGALYTPSDGRAEPRRAVPAIARGAVRLGAHVVSHCAVRGLDFANGKVAGVVTEHGRVAAPVVVCAGGAWTGLFCRSLGVTVPQLSVLGTVARIAPCPALLDGQAWSPAVAIRRRLDGGYTVAHGGSSLHSVTPDTLRYARLYWPAFRAGRDSLRIGFGRAFFEVLSQPARWPLDGPSPFERERMLDPAPEARVLEEMRAALVRWHPEIAAAPFVETWGGIIEASPDVLPVISAVDRPAGLYVATGFSGHGFGIGPGAGRLVADLVTGRAGAPELRSLRLGRFFDGSPIRPGPSI